MWHKNHRHYLEFLRSFILLSHQYIFPRICLLTPGFLQYTLLRI